jgi:hypothetical protein
MTVQYFQELLYIHCFRDFECLYKAQSNKKYIYSSVNSNVHTSSMLLVPNITIIIISIIIIITIIVTIVIIIIYLY